MDDSSQDNAIRRVMVGTDRSVGRGFRPARRTTPLDRDVGPGRQTDWSRLPEPPSAVKWISGGEIASHEIAGELKDDYPDNVISNAATPSGLPTNRFANRSASASIGPDGGKQVYLVGNSLGLPAVGAKDRVEIELDRWAALGVAGHTTGDLAWVSYHQLLTGSMAALVGGFRALLVQQGLTSDKLTDTEIQSFAASFCVFAKSSDNGDEFNVFREQAISETQSSLDPASLNKVIDAAVITFCPDEATRLGITVG